MSLFSPIHHTFAPHVDARFWWRRTLISFAPWRWQRGRSQNMLRTRLREQFHADAFLFASGREGLCALLRSMHLKPGEEVIIQGYTCVAVPNAIHTAGGVPVYVDIRKETLNIDPERVRSAITHRTRAIICQHTFAIPGPLEELRAICNEHKLALIEDCAHILPDASGPSGIAQTGDFAFFSFGRDKAATGIIGGAVISRSAAVSAQLTHEERQAAAIPFSVVLRLLLYPCMYLIARPFYGLKIGKLFLFVMKKLHMLIPILTTQEKCGKMSPVLHSMPNACAYLAQFQLTRHQAVNDHRRALTRYYLTEARKHDWKFPAAIKDDLPMQKFPLFVSKPEILRTTLKKHNIHLHDGWTQAVICPHSVNQSAMNYRPGSCPNAEQVARSVVTLPTHPTMTMRQACRLCEMIESLMK